MPDSKRLGKYRLIEEIGRGGFGAVYRAEDTVLGREVALKVLHPQLTTDLDFLKKFHNEARVMAALDNPYIVTIYDLGEVDGRVFIAMRYMAGGSLKQHMEKQGAISYEETIKIITQVCQGLKMAHAQGLIHRDIKPANILFDGEGNAAISDFGLAKAVQQSSMSVASSAGSVGTPAYRAPELWLGKPPASPATDIYSLGCVMSEMLSGKVVFDGESTDVVITQHLVTGPSIPDIFPKKVPGKMRMILEKMLAKESKERFSNIKDFLHAVEDLEKEEKLTQQPTTPKSIREIEEHKERESIKQKRKVYSSEQKPFYIGWLIFIIAVLGLGLFVFFGNTGVSNETLSEEPTTEKIKIANLSPLTGPVPTFGKSAKSGFQLAIDEWNANGGVLGREIEAIVEDSQCSADPAVNAANKVINQDGVQFIVGEICSSASIPVSEIAEEEGIFMISPTSTNTDVTLNLDGSTKKTVFRACFIDPFQGQVMAKFAIDQNFTKAFIMLDEGNDYVRGLAEVFQDKFAEYGGEIVGMEFYTGTDTDFSAILTAVAESGAEVLYLPDYFNVVNLVAVQAKELGVTAVMMGGDGWDSSDLDLEAVDGYFFSNHYSPDDSREVVVDWVTNYKAVYGSTPDVLATLAYDATNLLLAAIEEAGTDDPAIVADTMETMSYEAISGTITFDEYHNPSKNAVVLQTQDGAVNFVASVAP